MRLTLWLTTATVLLLAATTSRADPDSDVPEDAPALIQALQSPDAGARGAAAERIVKSGSFTIERVARGAGPLDDAAWTAFADALIGQMWPSYALPLVAAAHDAPEAHRRRLLVLAKRLDPRAGTSVTAAELDALVRKLLVEQRGLISDHDPYPSTVAVHGHGGVPIVLKLLRENGDDVVDYDRARDVLSPMAQPEDLPALRELLLAGKSSVIAAMHRLAALGIADDSGVVLDAVRAGHFDVRIAVALYHTPDHRAAAKTLRDCLANPERRLTEEDRKWAATVFAQIGSSDDLPLLEAWSASSRDAGTIVEVARALMRLGSRTGVDMLVRIVQEKEEAEPRPPSASPGRLRPEGFHDAYRLVALKALDVVATQSPTSGDEFNPVDPPKGPFEGERYGTLDRVAASVRAWWDASRDQLTFDAPAGRWRRSPR